MRAFFLSMTVALLATNAFAGRAKHCAEQAGGHGGVSEPVRLGNGSIVDTYGLIFPNYGFNSVRVTHCPSLSQLEILTWSAKSLHSENEKTVISVDYKSVLGQIKAAAKSKDVYSLEQLAKTFEAMGARVNVISLDKPECGCEAFYGSAIHSPQLQNDRG